MIFRNSVEVWCNKPTTFNVRTVSLEVIFRDTKVLQVKIGETISMTMWCANKAFKVSLISSILINYKLLTKNLKKVAIQLILKEWKTNLNPKLFKLKMLKIRNKLNPLTFWWHLRKFQKVKYKLKQIHHKLKEVAKPKYKNLKIKIVKLKLKTEIKIVKPMTNKFQLCKRRPKNSLLV